MNKSLGNFVKRHAESIAQTSARVSVLYVAMHSYPEKQTIYTDIQVINNVTTAVVYCRKSSAIPLLAQLTTLSRLVRSYYVGLKDLYKLNKQEFDLVHVNVISRVGVVALVLKIWKKIPFIITEHWTGYFKEDGRYKGLYLRVLTRACISSSLRVSVVSNALKDAMIRQNLISDYTVVPNVVLSLDEDIQNVVHTPDRRIKLITVSALDDFHKNISGLIKSFIQVLNRVDLELHIIGEGCDKDKLQHQAGGYIGKNIFFHDQLSHTEVLRVMSNCDIFILNSNFETFSVVTAEALMAGLPVIITACGGPEEFVSEDVGVVIPRNDVQKMADAILITIKNLEKYDRKKISAYAKSKFAEIDPGKAFYDIYKQCIKVWNVGHFGKKVIIQPDWKVLDVGSGHNPCKRANVLIDSTMGKSEDRSGKEGSKGHKGQELLIGDALSMPFKQNEFDYAIASHIAEHVSDPELFCKELQRVARRGYIETPGLLDDRFLNEPFHRWQVSKSGKVLHFKEKSNFKSISETFYKFFYANEDRYGHEKLALRNSFMLLLRKILVKAWKVFPYTSTQFEWEESIKCTVIHNQRV